MQAAQPRACRPAHFRGCASCSRLRSPTLRSLQVQPAGCIASSCAGSSCRLRLKLQAARLRACTDCSLQAAQPQAAGCAAKRREAAKKGAACRHSLGQQIKSAQALRRAACCAACRSSLQQAAQPAGCSLRRLQAAQPQATRCAS